MRWSTTLWALAVLIAWIVTVLHAEVQSNAGEAREARKFYFTETQNDGSTDDVVGSGSGQDADNGSGAGTDDEDTVEGSGVTPSGKGKDKVTPAVTPGRQLTACQQQRLSTPNFKTSYIPTCNAVTGKFLKLQCKGSEMCWCVNQRGIQVEGTSKIGDMNNPREKPDCEGGSNLTPCVTLLVKNLWEFEDGIRTSLPKCGKEGQFEPMQCHGNECWCVDDLGRSISGSAKISPEAPDCTGRSRGISYRPPIKLVTPDSDITVDEVTSKPDKGTAYIPGSPSDSDEIPIDGTDKDATKDRPNDTNMGQTKDKDPRGGSIPLIEQPGILAGIIGGAVVGLLCAILLIMFIVYRIRKKDEGSYALDEPTKARGAYAYQKAPDKEFYA